MDKKTGLNPESWVDIYADQLFSYTLLRVKDRGMAEDIVQDTFLSAWRARESYNGAASEKNWLYTICKNKIIDHYRKRSSSFVNVSENEEDFYFNQDGHWSEDAKPKEWGIDYQQPIEKKEFYNILNSCKRKLKEMQQTVFTMKYLDELDSDEICKTLSITQSSYWVLLHRAKLALRSCLEKNWVKA